MSGAVLEGGPAHGRDLGVLMGDQIDIPVMGSPSAVPPRFHVWGFGSARYKPDASRVWRYQCTFWLAIRPVGFHDK